MTLFILIVSCDQKPYKISQGYMYIQKEERRNEATKWQLVWEDDFNKGSLDTNNWRRIGLFESPKWKVPVEETPVYYFSLFYPPLMSFLFNLQ